MTPAERAQKIWMDYLDDMGRPRWTMIELRNKIATQIEEAVAEEFARGAIDQPKRCAAHKAAAYEDAAKITEKFTLESMGQDGPAELWLANKIRARAKEVGK